MKKAKDMPHPRYDWLMAHSEALDANKLLREPYDVLADDWEKFQAAYRLASGEEPQ